MKATTGRLERLKRDFSSANKGEKELGVCLSKLEGIGFIFSNIFLPILFFLFKISVVYILGHLYQRLLRLYSFLPQLLFSLHFFRLDHLSRYIFISDDSSAKSYLFLYPYSMKFLFQILYFSVLEFQFFKYSFHFFAEIPHLFTHYDHFFP